MKRRNLILLLGGASSGALSVGTGAFSSAQVERGVNVNVVEDDTAFVGYESNDITVDNEDEVTLVTINNQFAQDITNVRATVKSGDDAVSDIHTPEEIEAGEREDITARPHLYHGESVDMAVTVRVEAEGVTAEVFGDTETREFTLERVQAEITDVLFPGGGNAVEIDTNVETVTVEIQMSEPGEFQNEREWDTSKNLTDVLNGQENSGNVLAVRFLLTDREQIFLNPNEIDDKSDGRLPGDWKENGKFGTKKGDAEGNSSGDGSD